MPHGVQTLDDLSSPLSEGDYTVSQVRNSTLSRWFSFRAAVSRLFVIPTFAVFSFLGTLRAVR